MRRSRSVSSRIVLGLRTLANKSGKNQSHGVKQPRPTPPSASPSEGPPAAKPTPTPAALSQHPKPSAPSASTPSSKPSPPAAAASAPGPASEASTAGGGGQWNIHPSVPVDARLVGAGVVGVGLLAYNLIGSGDQQQQSASAATTEQVDNELTSLAALEGEAPVVAAAEWESQHAQQEASPRASSGGSDTPQQAQQVGEAEEPPPTYVEGEKVTALIEEVFTMDVSHLYQQAQQEGQSGRAEGRVEAAGGQPQGEAGRAQQASGPSSSSTAASSSGSPPGAYSEESGSERGGARRKSPPSHVDDGALAAMQSGVADSVGDLVASQVGKGHHRPPSRGVPPPPDPQAEEGGPTPESLPTLGPHVASASTALAGVSPRVKEILGIEQDLTPAGLIQQAQRAGRGAGEDWEQYRHRHRQAVADAQFIAALLETAADNVQVVLESKDASIQQQQAALEDARQGLRRQGEAFRELLKKALKDADRQAQKAMKLQAQHLAMAHAEMTVRERKERLAVVDEVRLKLNSLHEAFRRRSQEARAAHGAHQIAVGSFALQAALEGGQPLQGVLDYLRSACKEDALVSLALAAVPQEVAERGVWTRAQLTHAFEEDVQRVSRQLSWVPEGQGGFLTFTLAKLLSKLKVAERGGVAASVAGDCIDRDLAVVHAEIVNGQLLKAAEHLEEAVKGTAAAREVSAWVQQVRARVLAEQTAALLQAHASAITASLA